MDKQQTISLLAELLKDLDEQNGKKATLDMARSNRQNVLMNFKTQLEHFDSNYKSKYITEKIGAAPIKPNGLIKLAIPVYLVKKSKYEKDLAEYKRQYQLAEKAYYYDFQAQRSELQKSAENERDDALKVADMKLKSAEQSYMEVTERVNGNTFISQKYKNAQIVSNLIDYLRDGRADNLKEAINLWHNEEYKKIEMEKAESHRAEMLRLEQERLEAAQEAAEYQRMAYYAAQEAADSAKQAAEEAKHAADDVNYSTWNNIYSDSED